MKLNPFLSLLAVAALAFALPACDEEKPSNSGSQTPAAMEVSAPAKANDSCPVTGMSATDAAAMAAGEGCAADEDSCGGCTLKVVDAECDCGGEDCAECSGEMEECGGKCSGKCKEGEKCDDCPSGKGCGEKAAGQ